MNRNCFRLTLIILASALGPARAHSGETIVPDVVYGHKDGLALTFDVIRPEQQNGAGVLFIVSGGWKSGWAPPERAVARFRPLLDKGITGFVVRHGSSPKYDIPEIVGDVRRSVRYIRRHTSDFGVDANRLGVYGGSAGGHLALLLGTTADAGNADSEDAVDREGSRVAAVVAYYPPTDIRPWVQPDSEYRGNFPALAFDPELAGDFSPLLHVTADDSPTLLIHGDQDRLVPIDHSRKIHEEFKRAGVTSELLVIEGAGHGFRGGQREQAAEAMVRWFEEQLTAEQTSGLP